MSVSRTCWLQFCCNMPHGPLFSAHRGILLLRSFISSSNQGGTPKNGSIISTFNWSALHPTWTNYSTWICSKTVQPTKCAEKPFGTPKTMHDSTIFWCLIDGQVTPPLSPHGHELRALQQLWEQKEVLENCDAFVKISSSGVFLFLSCSFVVMIYMLAHFFGGRWTHDVSRWLDSWQPLGQRLYQNCRAPNLMKKTDSQRRTYHCITRVFFL